MALFITSRYYETFEMLKRQIKDSSIEEISVLTDDFKCTIEPENICTMVFNRIVKFMHANLFSKEETTLLIQNLLPCVKAFGGHKIGIVSQRLELINKLGKQQEHTILIREYELLINHIKEIQLCLTNKLNNKFLVSNIMGFETSLSEPKQKELYKALNGNYIECSEAEFLAMFSDCPKPIIWKKSNALLAFFVNDVFLKEKNYWDIAQNIFIKYNTGNYYTSLRQSFQTAYNNDNQEPKGWQTLKSTYKHLL